MGVDPRLLNTHMLVGWQGNRLVRYPGDMHMTMIGGTRKGKGVGWVIPWLLDCWQPMVVFDPKADALASTYWFRKWLADTFGGEIRVINPFNYGVSYLPFARDQGYNPFKLWPTNPNDPIRLKRAEANGDNIIIPTPHDPFWGESAAEVWAGILLYQMMKMPALASCGTVRAAISMATGDDENGDPAGLSTILKDICASGYEFAAEKVGPYLRPDSKSAEGVLHTLVTGTRCFSRPEIRASTRGRGFDWNSLKHMMSTVYIVLPVDEIKRCKPWLRMVLGAVIDELSTPERGRYVPRIIIDEAYQLEKMNILDTAYSIAAGLHFQITTIWQFVEQMRRLYGSESVFSANSGVLASFGPSRDLPTAEFLAKILGDRGVLMESHGTNQVINEQATQSVNVTAQGLPLCHPSALMRMLKPNIVASIEGMEHPCKLKAHPYFDTPWSEFDRSATHNPLRDARAPHGGEPDYYGDAEPYEQTGVMTRLALQYARRLPYYQKLADLDLMPFQPRKRAMRITHNGNGNGS